MIVDPYCLMGDVAVSHKSYVNLERLINYFGIQWTVVGEQKGILWHRFKQIDED